MMGLQLGNYGSDTDSDEDSAGFTQARVSEKPSIPPDMRGNDQLDYKGISRGRSKQPIKIGSSHALLRRAEDPLHLPDDESTDTSHTSSSKRTRILAATRTTGGKSGLVDMLPPPKKKPKILVKATPLVNMSVESSLDTSRNDTNLEESGNVSHRHTGSFNHKLKANDRIDLFGLDVGSASSVSTQDSAGDSGAMAISAAPAEPARDQSMAQYTGDADIITQSRSPSDYLISQGALGHAWKNVTDHNANDMPNWDVKQNMAEARQIEAERAKLLAAPVYAEQTSYKAVGRTNGLAGKRHQLSALLQDAHSNRRALEDRIAENKRNKREAGTKYGF